MKRFYQRPEITVGLIVGAILTLAISGSLDIFVPMGEGGWSESVRKTISIYFGPDWAEVAALRIFVGFAAILIVTLLGALIGALFSVLVYNFFRKMFHLLEKLDEE